MTRRARDLDAIDRVGARLLGVTNAREQKRFIDARICLLYTTDAADESARV